MFPHLATCNMSRYTQGYLQAPSTKVKLTTAPAPTGSTAVMPSKKHAHQLALQRSLTGGERNLEQDLTVIPQSSTVPKAF